MHKGGGRAVKKPLAHVTDHALLRYLERVKGVDVDAVRNELGHVVDKAIEAGAGATIIDGVRYVLNDKTIVTAALVNKVPERGRSLRRRPRKDDWRDGE